MIKPYYISESGLEALKQKLKELKTKKRREIAERLKEAKSMGDLSENAEYQEAKESQEFNESEIFELENRLRRVELITTQNGGDKVTVGSTIEVKSGLKRRTFTIVGPEEADPVKGFISNESPLGQAFLGKRVGDDVVAKTPGGEVKYKIVKIQ
ncbi:MAG: transcription elongation factor GreA [Parcubacteria group bacterium]|nr:transcription elongation factor GreA [Parcubacteria group bacterium]